MEEKTVGFIPLARTTFDIPFATQVTEAGRRLLLNAGFSLIGPTELVTDMASAQKTVETLSSQEPDMVVFFQATFADSTMIIALAEAISAPILLWALPETPSGGRLRLNSLCGVNLAAHALTLKRMKFDYIFSSADDPAAIAKITTLSQAGYVRNRLQHARIGVLGEHPPGLDTCNYDPVELKSKLGPEIVQMDLQEVFQLATEVEPYQIAAIRQQLDKTLENLSELEQTPLARTLSVYLAMKQLAAEMQLDGLAVRCWPEFFTDYGCAACGAMSMLSDELTPCSCEADVNGTITQLILQWLSNAPAFGSDFVSVDIEHNQGVFWHCGLAPLSMADPDVKPQGGIHSNRQMPLVMEFPLKAGEVTIARLSHASGEQRLVVAKGEMLPAPPSFSGTSGVVRFENHIQDVLDILIKDGLEHHLSLTYGDHTSALMALAEMLDLPVLRL